MLLKVIENIKHSQLNDTEFIIVGDPIYERQFAGLENVRYLYGIPDSELLLLYQSSDILLLPLKDATACNALLEGLSCALPIIVTDVGGVRDYVDETCAILTPPGDAEAMTEHLLGLLRDEQQRYKIGRSARRRAVERFRWALIAERVREIYTRLW
jgi:glycosyltransferase involved in cell wall biosynthesis